MIKIPVEPIKQETPNDCSITCLRMLLGYYGVKVSRQKIFDYVIKATDDGGSFLSEMARFARNQGFNVDLCAYNLYFTSSKDAKLDKNKLLKKLEKELRNSQRDKYYDLALESTIKGIKEGVNYLIKRPSPEVIKSYLKKRIPVSIRINYAALVGKQGDPFDSHDVVLSGLKDKKVYLVDPADTSQKWFDIEEVMFAIQQSKVISASGYLLAIKQKSL